MLIFTAKLFKGDEDLKQACVPNKEIKRALVGIIRNQQWYKRMETIRRSENQLNAILELDGTTAASLIQEVHNSPAVALPDYNEEESVTYCVMTGLLWSTPGKYIFHREKQAGKGRADLVYEPAIKGTVLLFLSSSSTAVLLRKLLNRLKRRNTLNAIPDSTEIS